MVERDDPLSNPLFEILTDWEEQLQAEDIDFEELGL